MLVASKQDLKRQVQELQETNSKLSQALWEERVKQETKINVATINSILNIIYRFLIDQRTKTNRGEKSCDK